MTDLEQALLVSGGILALVMLTQLGRREYTAMNLRLAVVVVAAFGFFYFRNAPTGTADLLTYAVGALIGLGFGLWAFAVTGVERDPGGAVFTLCGKGFVLAWVTLVVVRIGFILAATHVGSFRSSLGQFLADNAISHDAIAPFFVAMALAMLLLRVVLVGVRVASLRSQARERQLVA